MTHILTANELILQRLENFYQKEENMNKFLNIINQKEIFSLRHVDWFVTNYAKKYYTIIQRQTCSPNESQRFKVYTEYKLECKSYSKRKFDPFCRNERITIPYPLNPSISIQTTIGQLNFFEWAIRNQVIDYIIEHYVEIDRDMNERNSISKKASKSALSLSSVSSESTSVSSSDSIDSLSSSNASSCFSSTSSSPSQQQRKKKKTIHVSNNSLSSCSSLSSISSISSVSSRGSEGFSVEMEKEYFENAGREPTQSESIQNDKNENEKEKEKENLEEAEEQEEEEEEEEQNNKKEKNEKQKKYVKKRKDKKNEIISIVNHSDPSKLQTTTTNKPSGSTTSFLYNLTKKGGKKNLLLSLGTNQKTRKKREELSISAIKSLKKENVDVVVRFDS